MGSRQPDDAPGGVLVLDVAPATPSSSALPDDTPDLPDNVTLFTRHYTMISIYGFSCLELYGCGQLPGQSRDSIVSSEIAVSIS